MWGISLTTPSVEAGVVAAIAVVLAGVGFAIAGSLAFRRAKNHRQPIEAGNHHPLPVALPALPSVQRRAIAALRDNESFVISHFDAFVTSVSKPPIRLTRTPEMEPSGRQQNQRPL
jgi:hypothetical protein